jgi:arsenate reductase
MKANIVMYGIPNCDTVKKARVWLQEHQIDFVFHDFKKNGLTRTAVEAWLQDRDLDILINRKGTTWRALSDEQKQAANDTDAAIQLMLNSPSLIKRPVLCVNERVQEVGFSAERYQQVFASQIPNTGTSTHE